MFLERVALALGFEWLDVVRFENRVTDALEIQEGIESLQHQEVIEERRKKGSKRRYAMMGLAAVGESCAWDETDLRWWPRHWSICWIARSGHRRRTGSSICNRRSDWNDFFSRWNGWRRNHYHGRGPNWILDRWKGYGQENERSQDIRIQAAA